MFSNISSFSALSSALIRPHVERNEPNDADVYRAIVTSVKNWQKKQVQKRLSNRYVLNSFYYSVSFYFFSVLTSIHKLIYTTSCYTKRCFYKCLLLKILNNFESVIFLLFNLFSSVSFLTCIEFDLYI